MALLKWYLNPSQDVNWTYIRRSEGVQDVFWTSYKRLIYVLCPGGHSEKSFWNGEDGIFSTTEILFYFLVTQQTFTYLKSAIEALEKNVRYVQS